MRLLPLPRAILLSAFLTLGCGEKPGPNPGPDSSQGGPHAAAATGIEGTYLVEGIEFFGDSVPSEKIAKESELDRTVKISKDQIQFKFFKRETVRYTLDPSKSPAEIDVFPESPGKKVDTSYGIYKVEGKTLTVFLAGAREPQLRPREFKTLSPLKDGKPVPGVEKQAGGILLMSMKKVSDDTTFISEPPPQPKPPTVDEDGPVVAELTKKGFTAEKFQYGKFSGIDVTVPATLPLEALKGLNGQPRVRKITFKKKSILDPDHPVTDEAVQGLNKLDGLATLVFESCPKITAAAFRDLSRFPMLTSVSTSSMSLDDAATEELAEVKTLEGVSFFGAKLTDKSLTNLAKIKTLKFVWLIGADVTASGIKLLSTLSDLDVLALQSTPAVDAALGELNLPKLTVLHLVGSDITDEGLGKLPVLPKLRSLTLSGPKITDVGLKHLLKQPSLEIVSLTGTKVTNEAIEEIKKAKPKLVITQLN